MELKDPTADEKKVPLIAFVNPHSGGKMGPQLYQRLVAELGEENVFNLKTDKGPGVGLRKFNGQEFRCVVCGGDGTVNWVLGEIEKLGISPVPAAGIIPLGTGNDAARQFGWGHRFVDLDEAIRCVRRMHVCEEVQWDRWQAMIEVEPAEIHWPPAVVDYRPEAKTELKKEPDNPQPMPDLEAQQDGKVKKEQDGKVKKETKFSNYLSFGVDAQMIYEFHHRRENCRGCFCCRCCNMSWMGWYGFKTTCCCLAQTLKITVEFRNDEKEDWETIEVPSNYKGVVLLNLPIYAGGRRIWGDDVQSKKDEFQGQAPEVDDGKIEILGVESALHLGCVILKATRCVRLGQHRHVRITTEGSPLFAQLDGEPYAHHSSSYTVSCFSQVKMLQNDIPRAPCCCEC